MQTASAQAAICLCLRGRGGGAGGEGGARCPRRFNRAGASVGWCAPQGGTRQVVAAAAERRRQPHPSRVLVCAGAGAAACVQRWRCSQAGPDSSRDPAAAGVATHVLLLPLASSAPVHTWMDGQRPKKSYVAGAAWGGRCTRSCGAWSCGDAQCRPCPASGVCVCARCPAGVGR